MSEEKVSRRCMGITRRGQACRGRVMKGGDYCVAHRQTPPPTPPRSGEGSQGREEKNRGSEEGSQGREEKNRGCGEGSQGRGEPGEGVARSLMVWQGQPVKELQTIEDVIEDMLQRQSQLTTLIEEKTLVEPLNVSEIAKLLTLHGQNGSRIGRLLRDQRALSGASADGLLEAIGKALDELSTELGIEL